MHCRRSNAGRASESAASVREKAANAFITIAKPADPATEARRLLWEQPNTSIERDVLARGRDALPVAWKALASTSEVDRRAAAALLGWFTDSASIQPILSALAGTPGAQTRDQLLFDLNMILLTEGRVAAGEERDALATMHLRWLYGEISSQRIDSDIRAAVLRQKTLLVFPEAFGDSFATDLVSPVGSVQPSGARAVRAESPQAFLDAVKGDACGVAFHRITVANDVARVATTLFLPQGRIANQVWISLYRREAGQWVPLQVPGASRPPPHDL